MSGHLDYSMYDELPVGVLALSERRVVYANPEVSRILGVDRARLVGRDAKEVAAEVVSSDELEWVSVALDALLLRGDQLPQDTWVRLCPPQGEERAARVLRGKGHAPGETVHVLIDVEGETISRRLTEAMVVAANEFVRCREERDVLETAVEVLFRAGYWTAVLGLKDRTLSLLAQRQDEEMMRRISQLLGVPTAQLTWDAEQIPHFQKLFNGRRAVFTLDIFKVMDEAQDPQVARMMREIMPRVSMVDAPIFLGDEPFGFISVQGMHVTSNSVPTIELFARLIAGALENVRHHRRARERLQELTALQKELVSRERLAALGEAAGVLSHEARNPLGAILNSLAVLRRNPALDEDGRLVLDIAQEEAFRLDWLVRDLMELARPLEARSRPVKLEGVFEAAVSDLRRRLGRSMPEITVAGDASLPEVQGDPTLLKVAVENLLRNAAQIDASAPVRVRMTAEGPNVVFCVDDALPPSRREGQAEDFDPFAIVRPRGTGLGLAVVKRLVEAQGGSVRARNGGSRIEIALPAATSSD